MDLIFSYLFLSFTFMILKCNADQVFAPTLDRRNFRIKRQDGYVYDRPSVSFDLPSRPTPSTQAPTVDRTLAQQMYYAYPVPAPASGNVGSTPGSSTTAATTAAAVMEGAYNYRPSSNSNNGYDYNTPLGEPQAGVQIPNAGVQTNIGGQVTNTAQNSNTGYSSGYGFNTPSPTLSPSLQSTVVSTNAPKYLPPIAGDIGSVNIGVGSVSPSLSATKEGSRSTGQVNSVSFEASLRPSENYLPPLGPSSTGSGGISVTASTAAQSIATGGSLSLPNTGYLPPNQSSSGPSLISSPGSSPQPGLPPSGGYIPPSVSGSEPGTVTPPASTYLPPSLF